jgi:hypothetical protein
MEIVTKTATDNFVDLLDLLLGDAQGRILSSFISLHLHSVLETAECVIVSNCVPRIRLTKCLHLTLMAETTQLPLHNDIGAEQGNVLRRSLWRSDVDPFRLPPSDPTPDEGSSMRSLSEPEVLPIRAIRDSANKIVSSADEAGFCSSLFFM